MRLLTRVDGGLRLRSDVPASQPYAIMSHTWGEDKDEITYEDLLGGNIDKPGLVKINFCLKQAARDGYDYIWADTCCINKRDRRELGRAINMMYDWYCNAAICYVILADIVMDSGDITKSRWFTRGWTLQELVAPRDVRFYAGDRFLGDRRSLWQQINIATGIDVDTPLANINIVERFKWSLSRKTKEPEDVYYSLFGLLELEEKPTINYGEGTCSARERLFTKIEVEHGRRVRKQIQDLFDRTQRVEDTLTIEELLLSLSYPGMRIRRSAIKKPLPSTCAWLMAHKDFSEWWGMSGPPFFWIKGDAGSGKSTLMHYADSLVTDDRETVKHISYYFNARGRELEHSTEGLYRSLILQLLQHVPSLQMSLVNSISASCEPFSWAPSLLQHALQRISGELRQPVRCFIDTLDDCEAHEFKTMVCFLQDLASPWLHICFASRDYPVTATGHTISLELHDSHCRDIESYVTDRLDASGALLQRLSVEVRLKANGSFLWAVLAVDILNKETREGTIFNLERRLDKLPLTPTGLIENIIFDGSGDDERFQVCLYWILFSPVPMSGTDFYYAMAASLTPDFTSIFEEGPVYELAERHVISLLTSSSRSLAELTKGRVHVIHESVRKHLLSRNILHALCPEAEGDLASYVCDKLFRTCQTFLTRMLVPAEVVTDWEVGEDGGGGTALSTYRTRHPFLQYAADALIPLAERLVPRRGARHILALLMEDSWSAFFAGYLTSMAPNTQGWENAFASHLDEHVTAVNARRCAWVVAVLIRYHAVSLLRQACAIDSLVAVVRTGPLLNIAIRARCWRAAHLLIDEGAGVDTRFDGESVLQAAKKNMHDSDHLSQMVIARLTAWPDTATDGIVTGSRKRKYAPD